jgi:hypothetical protein
MRNLRSPGSLTVAVATAVLLLLLSPWSPSQAARGGGGGKPAPTATAQASATVSGSTANLATTVSRPASEVSALSCVVAGQGTSQNAACRLSTSSKSGASYAGSVGGLAAGSYTFTATYTMTNGTTARASASFAVGSGSVSSGGQATCALYGGTYTTQSNGWNCDAPAQAASALDDACTGVGVWTFYTAKDKSSRVSYTCSGASA